MFLDTLRINEDVVHIHDNNATSDEISKKMIHHSLERSWRIGESKEHHQGFEKAFVCDKSGLPFVTFFNSYVVITPTYVQLGKDLGTFQLVNKLRNQRKRIRILDC